MVRQQTPFRFTEREMDIAKGTDLPDLLTHLGYQVCLLYTSDAADE